MNGAGEGNRTLVSALGRPHSTIEPHPPILTPTTNITLNAEFLSDSKNTGNRFTSGNGFEGSDSLAELLPNLSLTFDGDELLSIQFTEIKNVNGGTALGDDPGGGKV